MSKGETKFCLDLHVFVVGLPGEVVQALDDDEHVVNANTETEEGQSGVHGGVREPEYGGDAHGAYKAHKDADDAGDRDVEPDLHGVDLAEHYDGVDEHGTISDENQINVKEDCIRADITEAASSIGNKLDLTGAHVEGDLQELLLPEDGGSISGVNLQASL